MTTGVDNIWQGDSGLEGFQLVVGRLNRSNVKYCKDAQKVLTQGLTVVHFSHGLSKELDPVNQQEHTP